jgi:AP2-like factor, euAP2 lineage
VTRRKQKIFLATIELCGFQVIVDDADVSRVLEQEWTYSRSTKQFLSKVGPRGSKERITLGRFILNPKGRLIAVQIDRKQPFNFSRSNLKAIAMSERQASLGKRKVESTSRYKGVSFNRREGTWRASIRPFGDSIFIGDFDTEDAAAEAYNKAARGFFGEAAYQNSISTKDPFPKKNVGRGKR